MVFRTAENISVRKVGDEVFVLHKKNKRLHTFNATGAFIWDLLTNGTDSENVIDNVVQAYEVDRQTAREDVQQLIDLCKHEKLLESI